MLQKITNKGKKSIIPWLHRYLQLHNMSRGHCGTRVEDINTAYFSAQQFFCEATRKNNSCGIQFQEISRDHIPATILRLPNYLAATNYSAETNYRSNKGLFLYFNNNSGRSNNLGTTPFRKRTFLHEHSRQNILLSLRISLTWTEHLSGFNFLDLTFWI